jgi:predicted dienelactone hydrolase
MRSTVALLKDTITAPGAPLEATVDYDRVATAGHSAGSGTAIRSAGDPQLGVDVDAYVAMSAGDAPGTSARAPLPDMPAVFMAGSVDASIAASETQRLYDRAPTPKRFYEYAKSGHLVFTDICQIGKEQGGVLALAKSFGIEVPERLQRLASDGVRRPQHRRPKCGPQLHISPLPICARSGVSMIHRSASTRSTRLAL